MRVPKLPGGALSPGHASTRIARRLTRGLRRLGWPGGLGVVLIAGAIMVGAVSDVRMSEEREALSAERRALTRSSQATQVTKVIPDRVRLDDFYASTFPGESALPDRLASLYSVAARHGITVQRVDYRTADEQGTPLRRISLRLPVQGNFVRIHAWLSDVLVAQPELSLESIALQRADSESGSVNAELRLSLYVGAGR